MDMHSELARFLGPSASAPVRLQRYAKRRKLCVCIHVRVVVKQH